MSTQKVNSMEFLPETFSPSFEFFQDISEVYQTVLDDFKRISTDTLEFDWEATMNKSKDYELALYAKSKNYNRRYGIFTYKQYVNAPSGSGLLEFHIPMENNKVDLESSNPEDFLEVLQDEIEKGLNTEEFKQYLSFLLIFG